MASSKLTVIAQFRVKPGQEEAYSKDLQAMVLPSRLEEGCLNYDVFQSNDDPHVFFTYENWTGKPALDAHMQTPHFETLEAKSKAALAQPMKIDLLTMQSDQAR